MHRTAVTRNKASLMKVSLEIQTAEWHAQAHCKYVTVTVAVVTVAMLALVCYDEEHANVSRTRVLRACVEGVLDSS